MLPLIGRWYLGFQLAKLPFVPFDLFDWMARILPGGLVTFVGLFARPRQLTVQDLMAYPTVTEAITLAGISNRVRGDLTGTSYWTGVRRRDVLEDLGLMPQAQQLYVEAAMGSGTTPRCSSPAKPPYIGAVALDWLAGPGPHTFTVRAIDARDEIQTAEETDPQCSGATGSIRLWR